MKISTVLRFAKYAVLLGVAMFVMGATPAHADGVFAISGATFSDGNTLTGTFTISGGVITAADLTVSGVSDPFSTLFFESHGPGVIGCFSNGGCTLDFTNSATLSSTDELAITLIGSTAPGTSLANYDGGPLFSSAYTLDLGQTVISGQTGMVTAVATPEPSTYLLLFGGLAALSLLRRVAQPRA